MLLLEAVMTLGVSSSVVGGGVVKMAMLFFWVTRVTAVAMEAVVSMNIQTLFT